MDAAQLLATRFGELVELGLLKAFAASGAIGLLIGLERERHPASTAGLRTFALTALFGTASALLGELGGTPWPTAIGLLLVGAMAVAAQRRDADPAGDPGTTTTIAILLCFILGTMVWHGLAAIAASLAVVTTTLLYLKPELKGLSARITRRDMLSILQFGALSLVVLPALPDRGYGPHGALNPHQIWLMVVLISGVSLAGYVALRLVGARHGLLLVGFMGGLVSSTATTATFARRARVDAAEGAASAVVVLLAGSVVFARVALVCAVVAPTLLPQLAPALMAGCAPMLVAGLANLRRLPAATNPAQAAAPQVGNPAELSTAVTFGAFYALVLLLAAELTQRLGGTGLYGVALVSGLTDVDALTLSSLRLFGVASISAEQAVVAIALAFLANIGFKFAMACWIGGSALARRSALGFVASAAALLVAAGLAYIPAATAAAAVALRQ
jgi:uncharacterized membrane protein (DUF4010 family)